ncbi:MAG: hypothetical protein RLZZ576_352 [Actinomycetota bacterium]
MIKSLASKMRKALVIATSAAVAFTGLTALPASAASPVFAADESTFGANFNATTALTNNEVTIGEGIYTLSLDGQFSAGETWLNANVGKTVSAKVEITDPDGKTVNISDNNGYDSNYLRLCNADFITCDNTQSPNTTTLVIKNTHKYGYFNIMASYYGESSMSEEPVTLKPGKYTWNVAIEVDGQAAPVVANNTLDGVVKDMLSGRYYIDSNPITVGTGVTGLSGGIGACIDSTKVAVGDVVTPSVEVNNAPINANDVDFYFSYRGSGQQSRPSSNFATTATVTQDDLDYGLTARASFYNLYQQLGLSTGSTVEAKIAVVDQDGNDVSGSCAPEAPGKPTLTLSGTSLTATFALAKFADSYSHRCEFSLATTPNVVAYKGWSQNDPMNPNSPNRTCSYQSPQSGKAYVVRVYADFYQIKSPYSEASESVTVPASGYTISSPVSGLTDGGKVSVAGTADTDSSATRIFASADGKGGTYRLATFTTQVSCPPCGPSNSVYKLRKSSASALDSTFGTNGTLDWDPVVPGSMNANIAYYGASADNFTLTTTGYDMMTQTIDFEFVQGNAATKTLPVGTKVAGSVFQAVCAAQGSGWTTKMSQNSSSLNVNAISAPTAKQLFNLSCYKEVTMADNVTKIYQEAPVIITIDNATTVNVVKVLGEHSANVNQTSSRFSVNPSATGSSAAVTLFVTKQLVTGVNMGMPSGDVVSREIVRIGADLSVTTTANAWTVASDAISAQPSFTLPVVNDGTINAILRYPGVTPSFKLIKVPASGAATAGADVVLDKAADFTGLNLSFPLGIQPGNATDLTVMATAATKAAVATIKVATGAAVAGEIVSWTFANGNGQTSAFVYEPSNKDVYWWFNDSTAEADKLSIYKWRDPLYVKPVGPVPAVTSKNLEYATNTPAAGTKVTFTGTNLDIVTGVKFGSVAATLGTKTATSLEVTVPAGVTGTVAITIESANGNGAGGNFTYVGANKVAQTVTLDAGANTAAVGDADRTLSATVAMTGYTAVASLTYSSTTASVCTVTGNKLKFVGKGTCSVKATQAGSSWTAEGVATKDITVTGPDAQTVSIKTPGSGIKAISPEGYFAYVSSSSGLPVTLTFNTPSTCKKGTFGANHIINVKVGTCTITATQAGSADWSPASKVYTYVVTKESTTKINDFGNVDAPVALSNNGSKTNVLSEIVSWKKSTGALTIASRGVWVGPITATATFKVGAKSYSCKVSYGTLKGVSASSAKSVKTFSSSSALCAGKTTADKAALAALKKVSTPTQVKIVVVRDLRNPTKYTTKGQGTTRAVYVTIG